MKKKISNKHQPNYILESTRRELSTAYEYLLESGKYDFWEEEFEREFLIKEGNRG